MPAVSTRLNRKAHFALRHKKNKFANNNANNGNNLMEAAKPSSSPTGVDDFVSDFASDDKKCDVTASSEKQLSIELQRQHTPVIKNTSHGSERADGNEDANNGNDDTAAAVDDNSTAADETNRSIALQDNLSAITRSSSSSSSSSSSLEDGVDDGTNSEPNKKKDIVSPITLQLNHVKRFPKVRGPKARASPLKSTHNTLLRNKATSKTVRLNEKILLDDTNTTNETEDVTRLEDEDFIDRIEGLFLNGIEGIEDGLASIVPSCISPASADGCRLFGSGSRV